MSAAPAASPQQIQIPGGWFPFPKVIADKLPLLTPAERAYLILAYRHGKDGRAAAVTETMWVEKTRMTPQSRRNVVHGLAKKKWLPVEEDEDVVRVAATGRHDLRAFTGWARHADPEETRTEGRAPTKAATPAKVHAKCENGCALLSPEFSTFETKPVLPSVPDDAQRGADSGETPARGKAPSGPAAGSTDSPTLDVDPEVKWAKTLAVMRAELVGAGVALLLRILAVIVSFGTVSDLVLARAVRIAVKKRWPAIERIGPILLVNLVPEVLAAMRHQGQQLDLDSEPGPRPETAEELDAGLAELAEQGRKARDKIEAERAAAEAKRATFMEDKRRARRIKADSDAGAGSWTAEEVEWALDFLWRARGGPS